jgi:Lon protease-like protein
VVGRRAYTDDEIEAAIQALSEEGRLDEAQYVVASGAPALQRILNQALAEADWFGSAHAQQLNEAAGLDDADERLRAVRTLLAEETQVSMLIGVAVGYELAHELMDKEKS